MIQSRTLPFQVAAINPFIEQTTRPTASLMSAHNQDYRLGMPSKFPCILGMHQIKWLSASQALANM